MGADIWLVLRWWGTLFFVGAAAQPLTRILFGQSNRSWKHHTLDPRVSARNAFSIANAGGRGDDNKNSWWDGGYLFSKAVGMATVTWVVYVLGTLRVLPFLEWSIWVALAVVFVGGILLQRGERGNKEKRGWGKYASLIILEELFFLAALVFWSWIKAHEPSIRGLEKFMDYGFMQSILNSRYFPPADMWYSPLPINYYYFGHLVTAVLTKLSGLDLAVTFNLMLATIFALTLTMSFSIGYQLIFICHSRPSERLGTGSGGNPSAGWRTGSPIRSGMTRIFAGLLTAFLVTLAGNLQTMYAFTRGYTGDNVKPFWELGWKIGEIRGMREIWGKIGEGMNTYWYANATRFIPYTIHEFPSYSFVVSDVHGHVLSLPFVLLAIGMLIQLSAISNLPRSSGQEQSARLKAESWKLRAIFYGFLVGVLLMTNALDGPIYFALLGAVLVIIPARNALPEAAASLQAGTHSVAGGQLSNVKKIGISIATIAGVAILTSLPFLYHFKSFVTGLAVNCPPALLANTKIGPIIFEGVEKCQRSPIWMLWVLWGFFIYCGGGLIYKIYNSYKNYKRYTNIEIVLLVFFFFSIALIIFPEFFYFKDIYPMHFRSNTMFKLGYQAFILFSIVAGYTIIRVIGEIRKIGGSKGKRGAVIFLIVLLPQLFLVSIFPIFSVRSYFNSLRQYQGLYGFAWMQLQYPDDWAGVEWLNHEISDKKKVISKTKNLSPITSRLSPFSLVEADGDSYTDYARFSAFTGIPTVIGWPVHEWLWRGGYQTVPPRREDVRQMYESEDALLTRSILEKYSVRYIIIGALERQKYKNLQEWKFGTIGRVAFQQGATVVYEVKLKPVSP